MAYLKWSEGGSQVRFKRLQHQLRLLGDLRPVPIVIEHTLRSLNFTLTLALSHRGRGD